MRPEFRAYRPGICPFLSSYVSFPTSRQAGTCRGSRYSVWNRTVKFLYRVNRLIGGARHSATGQFRSLILCPSGDLENPLDHRRILHAGKSLPRERSECPGHDPHPPSTARTGLNVDVEDTSQALRPGHGCPALRRRLRFTGYPGPFALFYRPHPRTVFAVRGKYTMQRVRLTPGLDTGAASLAMKSTGAEIGETVV